MALKVTIEEIDIKGAIETYVRGMIPGLADGTAVEIDISATRGPAGMTANITLLSPEDQERIEAEAAAKSKPAVTRKPRATAPKLDIAAKIEASKSEVKTVDTAKPSPEKEPEAQPEPVPVVEEAATVPVEEVQVEEAPFDTENSDLLADGPEIGSEEALAAEAAVEQEIAEESAEAAPVEAEPAPVKKSLFAGLAKPSNG